MTIEIISIISGFVLGGGLTAFLNYKFQRKITKIEMTEKIVHFYEDIQNKTLSKYNELTVEYEKVRNNFDSLKKEYDFLINENRILKKKLLLLDKRVIELEKKCSEN